MDTQAGPPPNHRIIAALSYLLGVITGVIFLYVEPYNQDEFVRFHARQSIIFSIAWFAVQIIVGVFVAVMPHPISRLLSFLLAVFNIATAIFWVILMYKAYIGERYRIPELADWAESMGF
ncbi:MAG TPA: DUF4870 domain-containing protein [Candidatus Binataceae bacterium]|nr:DUF4870 domain-containing protein [Candidatus Binataceae bacterium]